MFKVLVTTHCDIDKEGNCILGGEWALQVLHSQIWVTFCVCVVCVRMRGGGEGGVIFL